VYICNGCVALCQQVIEEDPTAAPHGRSAAALIDRHFAAENAHDVDATLATYTDDILWDDVTHPRSPFRGKQAVAEAYGGILDAIPDLELRSVWRFECGSHVVDESILSGHVVGDFAGIPGGGAPVSFRLLHVFDIKDGLISRENAWFDSAAVVRQVESFRKSPSPAGGG
jgi:steroid delta-isomerase-like uncharacterized protein